MVTLSRSESAMEVKLRLRGVQFKLLSFGNAIIHGFVLKVETAGSKPEALQCKRSCWGTAYLDSSTS